MDFFSTIPLSEHRPSRNNTVPLRNDLHQTTCCLTLLHVLNTVADQLWLTLMLAHNQNNNCRKDQSKALQNLAHFLKTWKDFCNFLIVESKKCFLNWQDKKQMTNIKVLNKFDSAQARLDQIAEELLDEVTQNDSGWENSEKMLTSFVNIHYKAIGWILSVPDVYLR